MNIKRVLLAAPLAVVVAFAYGLMPANAAARNSVSVSFFGGSVGPVANGSAHWSKAQSNDSDPFSMQIDVPEGTGAPSFYSSYGGIDLHHVAGPAPANEPGFDELSTITGPSGGSPRLVMNFSDGGNIYLYADSMTTTWQTVGGGSGNGAWDSNGGSCGFVYHTTYSVALACHTGATVTSAYVVSDSGWLYNSGYTNWIDNLQYGGAVISQPSDNGNS